MKLKFLTWENKNWTHSDLIALTGVVATILGVIVALAPDEVRCVFHLSSHACSPTSHSIVRDSLYRLHQVFVSVKDADHIAERMSDIWHRLTASRISAIPSPIE